MIFFKIILILPSVSFNFLEKIFGENQRKNSNMNNCIRLCSLLKESVIFEGLRFKSGRRGGGGGDDRNKMKKASGLIDSALTDNPCSVRLIS